MSVTCRVIRQIANGLLRRCRRKRAVVLMGAGASIEYKAPATGDLTNAIERAVMADALATDVGNGWVIANDGSAAVWERGFQAFLNAPDDFRQVLSRLRINA
jgi:hypothetical protein